VVSVREYAVQQCSTTELVWGMGGCHCECFTCEFWNIGNFFSAAWVHVIHCRSERTESIQHICNFAVIRLLVAVVSRFGNTGSRFDTKPQMELVPPASPRAEEDRILIIAARNGEAKAFEKLMQRYRKSVYYTLLKMVRNEDDAEDLTQEAFAKAFGSIHNFDAKYSFSTWLFRIATNNCIDFIRKKKLQTYSIHQNQDSEGNAAAYSDIRDEAMNPNEQMLSDQRKRYVRTAVEKLSPRYKQLIELRYFNELSYEEIADELQIPLGTVKAQLHRAKELLNTMMNHLEDKI